MATYKIVGDNPDDWDMVPMDQYEAGQQTQQAQQVQQAKRQSKMEMVAKIQNQPVQAMPQQAKQDCTIPVLCASTSAVEYYRQGRRFFS